MTDDRMTMDARAQAVEAMARRIASGTDACKFSDPPPCDTSDIGSSDCYCYHQAAAALDALLSSGLAVLMGSLEQERKSAEAKREHWRDRALAAEARWDRIYALATALRSREGEGT